MSARRYGRRYDEDLDPENYRRNTDPYANIAAPAPPQVATARIGGSNTTAPATAAQSLADQLRAQWGGDWNINGVDRAEELARLLSGNGVNNLSDIKWQAGTQNIDMPQYGSAGRETWGEDGPPKTATEFGNLTMNGLGWLGSVNNDDSLAGVGSSKDKPTAVDIGNGRYDLGWSAKGHGNVTYSAVSDGNGGYALVPVWGSSSDMNDVRTGIKMAAVAAGGMYGGAIAEGLGSIGEATNIAGSLGVTNPVGVAAVNGAARGAITGGLSSGIQGNSILDGALRGGVSGGIGGGLTAGIGQLGIGDSLGLNADASKALNSGLANTVKAGILGGNIKDAAIAGVVNTGIQQADLGSEVFDNYKLSSGFDKTLASALTAGLTGNSVGDAALSGGIKTGIDYLDPGKSLGLEGAGKTLANGTIAAALQGNKGLNPNAIANGIYGLGSYIFDEYGKPDPSSIKQLEEDDSSDDIDNPSMLPRVTVDGKSTEDPYDYTVPLLPQQEPTATLPTVVSEGKKTEDPYDYNLDDYLIGVGDSTPAPQPEVVLPPVVSEGKKTEDPYEYNLDDYLVGVGNSTPQPEVTLPPVSVSGNSTKEPEYNLDDYLGGIGDITPAPQPEVTLPPVSVSGNSVKEPEYNLDDYLVGVGDPAPQPEVTLPPVLVEGKSTPETDNVLPRVEVEGKSENPYDFTLPPATDTKITPPPALAPAPTPTASRPAPAPSTGGIIGGITPAPKPSAPTPAAPTPAPVVVPASNTSVARWLEQGRYGPIVRTKFAADGGLMETNMKHYDDGGEVDGGDYTFSESDLQDLINSGLKDNAEQNQQYLDQSTSDINNTTQNNYDNYVNSVDWGSILKGVGGNISSGLGSLLSGVKSNPVASIGALLGAISAYKQANKAPTIIGGGYTGTPKSHTAVQQQVQGRYGPVVQTSFAAGGVASLPPRFVQGAGDGMSDSIPAAINGDEPAQIADGEFIIPADVVSHLGNGSSKAGAEQLHAMMDRIRQARTGSKEQAPQINPSKFMAGGIASLPGYAMGGEVAQPVIPGTNSMVGGAQAFDNAPASTSSVIPGTTASATTNNTTTNIDPSSSPLSPIYGDYVMDALGRSQALNNLPFQAYTGQRYADQNGLQQQAMQGIGSLNPVPQFDAARQAGATALTGLQNYQPMTASSYGGSNVTAGTVQSGLDASDLGTVQRFMNPYQQAVIDITKREADRNYQLQNAQRSAAAVKAGAFGGSRHGFVDAEANRNYNIQLNDIQAQGGDRGWTQAMDALTKQRASTLDADKFNVSSSLQAQGLSAQTAQQANALTENSRQFAANSGLGALNAQLTGANTLSNMTNQQLSGIQGLANNQWNMGTASQGLDQRNLDFGYQQYQDSLNDPQKKIDNQLKALQGLPLSTVARNVDSPNAALEALLAGGGLYNLLGGTKP